MPQGGGNTRDFSYGLGDVVEATKSAGATLGGILKERMDKKEYDDFLAGPNKDFSQALRSAQDTMMDEDNPDGPMQGIKQLQGAMQSYMDEGAKYPNNPLVAQRIKQSWDMNMAFIKQEFVMQHQNAMMSRQKTLDAAKIQQGQVGMVKDLSIANKNNSMAGKADAQAADLEQKSNPLFSGMPGTIQGADDNARAQNMWNAIQAQGSRPRSAAEQKQTDFDKQDIRMSMAQNKIYEMAGRGEKRTIPSKMPGGIPDVHVYDPHSKSDLDAVAATIDPQTVDAAWTMKTAKREAVAQKLDPGIFDQKYGVLVDPTKASAFNPITRAVPDQTVGKIMMGVGGWSQLADPSTKAEPKSVEDAVTRLPAELDHVSGPIGDLFRQMPSVAKDENIKSMADLKMQLWKHGKEVVDNTFGAGADYSTLDEGMKKNRASAVMLVQAMTDKYADQIAVRMGIKHAPPAARNQSSLTDKQVGGIPGFDDLFRGIGAAKNKVSKLYNEYTE